MEEHPTISDHLSDQLIENIKHLLQDAQALEASFLEDIKDVHPDCRNSARNLLHYLSVRRQDVRQLQHELSVRGLSSLGRMEAHTMATLDSVLTALCRLHHRPIPSECNVTQSLISMPAGETLLSDHAQTLLGPPPSNRSVRIMVTMPSDAAVDSDLVRRLLIAGMDVMRINCAHDGPEAWSSMVENLRKAERETGRRCRILADLGGQKLRTGPITSPGRILKLKPKRDIHGRVMKPESVWVTPRDHPENPPSHVKASLCLEEELIRQIREGDYLHFREGRGKRRKLKIVKRRDRSCLGEIRQTAYCIEDGEVELHREDRILTKGSLANLPTVEDPLILHPGSLLILMKNAEPGRPAVYDENQNLIEPARIACSLPDVFDRVRIGEHIWFDDGTIGGVIEAMQDEGLSVRITQARPSGSKLRADKGINLPETDLDLPALTPKDLEDLKFMAPRIDMVGLSFLRNPQDVHLLEDHLQKLGAGHLGIILKIENRMAFERLPRILLASLRSPPVGVMVARGDLAVEMGFDRLAEVQEEILWMCEAAHIPVIWATQVLEGLTKTGSPTRAEVTDAAMSGRAECVMMNKGPYIIEAVEFLNDILERMQAHQQKKTSMLRKLSISKIN